MNEIVIRRLEEAGIAWTKTLPNLMDRELIYLKYLKRFPDNEYYPLLVKAFEENDCSAAFHAAHTLRGTTGNLGILPMYECLVEMTEELRAGDLDAAKLRIPALTAAWDRVVSLLKEL